MVNKSSEKAIIIPAAIIVVLAFCSISYELLLTRFFATISDRRVLWQSVTIGLYLGSLGLGTILSEKIKTEKALQKLFVIEIILASVAAISINLCYTAYTYFRIYFIPNFPNFFLTSGIYPIDFYVISMQSLTIVIGFLSGFEINLLLKLLEHRVHNLKTNVFLFLNYSGTLVGTVIYLYFLYPNLNFSEGVISIALINLLMIIPMLTLDNTIPLKKALIGYSVLIAMISGSWLLKDKTESLALKAMYHTDIRDLIQNKHKYRSIEDIAKIPEVTRFRSQYQYIDMVNYDLEHTTEAQFRFNLYLDRHYQFSTKNEFLYHGFFIHGTIQLNGKVPKKILVLGAGDGLAVRDLLAYSQTIEKIDVVELDPEMIRLATKNKRFLHFNTNSFSHPKVNIIQNDAFVYLRNTHQKYDAIFIDFPYPYNDDLARLYSYEFYRFCNMQLEDDGFMVLDFPIFYSQNNQVPMTNKIISSTLTHAGFKSIFGFKTIFDKETFVLTFPSKRNVNRTVKPWYEGAPLFFKQQYMDSMAIEKYEFKNEDKWINSVFDPKFSYYRDQNL